MARRALGERPYEGRHGGVLESGNRLLQDFCYSPFLLRWFIMSDSNAYSPERLEAVAFVGESLAPFFLQDPAKGSAAPVYAAFAGLDAGQAAREWPFGDEGPVREGLGKMVAGLADGVTDDLLWEYRRLFVGPGAKPAEPWGSVYTDHDGVIFGESTLALRSWMRRNGVARIAGGEGDPDDHIGLLLLMMAWIARNRPDLLCEFLQLHVLTWSSHYLEKLQQAANHALFKGLAVLTRASLEGIQGHFAIDVEYPRYYR